MAGRRRSTKQQQHHAVADGQGPPSQRLNGHVHVLRAQFTAPNSLTFAYQNNELCFVDEEQDVRCTLKKGVAPPTTGLRAQFIWGTQSSSSTAPMPAEVTCTSRSTTLTCSEATSTCLEAVPDTVLQLIGQQLVHDATSTDAECEAAAAAASLACTGSRAALVTAHAVWALLDPDSIKPDTVSKHVEILQQYQALDDNISSKPDVQRLRDDRMLLREDEKELSQLQPQQHAAEAALCALADPLQCPLHRNILQSLQQRHRALAARDHLHRFDLTVHSLPCECGIRAAMKEWIRTGCLDGIKHNITLAVQKIRERMTRLNELQEAGEVKHSLRVIDIQVIDRYQQCREYVRTGRAQQARSCVKYFRQNLSGNVRGYQTSMRKGRSHGDCEPVFKKHHDCILMENYPGIADGCALSKLVSLVMLACLDARAESGDGVLGVKLASDQGVWLLTTSLFSFM